MSEIKDTGRASCKVGVYTLLCIVAFLLYNDWRSHNAFRKDIDEISSRFSELESAVRSLRENVDEFDYTNWREVVPEVKSDTNKVENEMRSLERTLYEIERRREGQELEDGR